MSSNHRDRIEQASALCRRCGLCCDGALFSHAPLRPGELATLKSLALPVVERGDGSSAIELGCAAHEGRGCRIYAQRPLACRQFSCRLHTAVVEGEVSLDEAVSVLDEARRRMDAVDRTLEADRGHPLVRMRRRLARHEPVSPESWAAWDEAERFLDQHFRHARSRVRPCAPAEPRKPAPERDGEPR